MYMAQYFLVRLRWACPMEELTKKAGEAVRTEVEDRARDER
jgi:hypothetical protein